MLFAKACAARSAKTRNAYAFWRQTIFLNDFIDDCERVGLITIRRVIKVEAGRGKLLDQVHVKWEAILREAS